MQTLRKHLILLMLVVVLALPAWSAPMRPTHAKHALVTSVHGLASEAGVEVMKQGGNAIDAAVATGFALAVVHPQAGNFVDYREKAPAAATANMYLDAQGNVIPGASTVGYKAVGVPGSVAGLAFAQKKYGKLPLAKVMEPAIRLARDGYPLAYEDAEDFHSKHLSEFPESKRIFQRDGNYYQPGEIFKQPDLARTLERIAKNPDDFYHGQMAQELVADMKQGGGLITAGDLSQYEVKEREPIHGTYRGLDVYSAPPPSSGGIALVEALNILEGYDLGKLGNRSAEAMHLTIEAFRRAFFDRAEFLGDPDFAKIPVAQLIDKRYGLAWREGLNPDKSSRSADLQRPAVFTQLDQIAAQHGPPREVHEPENTTHYSVVDADGNAVSVTTTLNGSFGAYATAKGLGFLLNNEMDDFASKPGVPNMYGLIQGPANAIGPDKRPLSAMTPTIVTKDGKLLLVLGSPGGPTIITTVANVLMGVVDYGMNIQEAVNAPRFHNQWLPDATNTEQGFSPDTIKLLEGMGHKINVRKGYWGDAECIAIDQATGERLGAPDGRNNGKAVGY